MNKECNQYATSEDYADFLVEYSGTYEEIINRIDPECIYRINNRYAIAYKRLDSIPKISLERFAYNEIPKCYGLMDATSIESTGAIKVRRQPNLNLYGRDVLIGFIDTGIDYTNKLFINADNTTRIVAMWDQTEEITEGEVPFGRVYSRENINNALISDNSASIIEQQDTVGHGTFLAAIAGGNEDEENDFTGMAPLSELVVVKLRNAKQYLKDYYFINTVNECYQENNIMLGIEFLLEVARNENKPIVICIGVGTNQGDHNGRSYLEQYIDTISDEKGVIVVIAGGNEVNKAHHYRGIISYSENESDENRNEKMDSVEIKVGSGERGFTAELWIPAPNVAAIGIISPTGDYVDKISSRPYVGREISFLFDNTKVYIDYKLIEESTGDQVIVMRFERPAEGIWTVNVYYDSKVNGEYNIWLPISNFISDETFFLRPEPDVTLCSPANSVYSVVASGYNHKNNSIYINSSRGYTRYGRVKPDIAAPAVDVYGPLGRGYGRMTGTSIAAAHTAGGVALLLEWAVTEKNDINIDSLKMSKYIIRGADKSNNRAYPNREWGWGTLNIYGSLDILRGIK